VTNAVDTGLLADTTYFYRVRAEHSDGQSPYSSVASATTVAPLFVPRAPSDLVAAAGNGIEFYRSQMILHWRDRSANESGFIIERSGDGDGFSAIGSVGANTDHYIDHGLDSATSYYYRVRSFNGAGTSPPSNLAGEETHPQGDVALLGATVTFHAGSEGQAPIQYQWFFNNSPITGATAEAFTIHGVAASDEGNYSAMVTDANGQTVGNPAYLFVIASPFIVSDPVSRTNLLGTAASFGVDVIGHQPFTYQWRHDGVVIPGASTSMFSIPLVHQSDEGSYDVVVQNDYGASTSRSALLVVQAMRVSSIEALTGQQVKLTFTAPANQSCTILYTPRLGEPWTSVTNYPSLPSARVIQLVTPASQPSGFYRLQLP
jgi:hypothetical protein